MRCVAPGQVRWAVNGAVVHRDRPERRGRQPHRAGGRGDRAARSLSRGWAGCGDRPVRPGQNPAEAAREARSHAAIVVAAGGDGTVSRWPPGSSTRPPRLAFCRSARSITSRKRFSHPARPA